jgi:hypothetical protein
LRHHRSSISNNCESFMPIFVRTAVAHRIARISLIGCSMHKRRSRDRSCIAAHRSRQPFTPCLIESSIAIAKIPTDAFPTGLTFKIRLSGRGRLSASTSSGHGYYLGRLDCDFLIRKLPVAGVRFSRENLQSR